MTRRAHPGNKRYAREILVQGITDGFDLARSGPYVPEDVPADDRLLQRQLTVQTEGPSARAEDPKLRDDFHAREAEMGASDRELINVAWDREVMAAFARGDMPYFFDATYEQTEAAGGNGGHEMAMWVALAGVLDGAPATQIVYEPVKPWMGGVGLVGYGLESASV